MNATCDEMEISVFKNIMLTGVHSFFYSSTYSKDGLI